MLKQFDSCNIQPAFLRGIAIKKILQGQSTLALMDAANSENERLMIIAVALMDVCEWRITGLNQLETRFVKQCQYEVQKFLVERRCS